MLSRHRQKFAAAFTWAARTFQKPWVQGGVTRYQTAKARDMHDRTSGNFERRGLIVALELSAGFVS